MDRIWKYFTVLVLIEMIFLISLYATIFKNSTTLSNVEIIEVNERGQDFVNENNTAFTFQPHSKLDRNKNTEINHYKSKRLVNSVTADVMMNSKQQLKTKSPPFSDIIKKMRTGGEKNNSTLVKLANSKKWSIRTKAKLRLYNTSYISTKSGKSCKFLLITKVCTMQESSYHLLIIYSMFTLKLTDFMAYLRKIKTGCYIGNTF